VFYNDFFPPSALLPIISCGGLTVGGGGSMTVRAAALQRIATFRVWGVAVAPIALLQTTLPKRLWSVGSSQASFTLP